MLVNSSRVGPVEVTEQEVIDFSEGVLGLPDWRRAVMLPIQGVSGLSWLQFLHDEDAAFLLLDVASLFPGFNVGEAIRQAGLRGEATVQTIVSVPGDDFSRATTNLMGPIIIEKSVQKPRHGRQVVLHESDYPLRQPLFGGE